MRKLLERLDLRRTSTMVNRMGDSKKDAKSITSDRHISGFMVRLPQEYRESLDAIRGKSRRTITEEIKIALEEYFRKHDSMPPTPPTPSK